MSEDFGLNYRDPARNAVVEIVACGGFGQQFASEVMRELSGARAVSLLRVDPRLPPDVPASRGVHLRGDQLPRDVKGPFSDIVRASALRAEEFVALRSRVSADGMAQIPALSFIAALVEFERLRSAIESDVRQTAAALGGASTVYFITIASLLGGTGTAAAIVAGLAARQAARGASIPSRMRWLHVALTSTIVDERARTRRTLALEHARLLDFEALMRHGAEFRLPGVLDPIVPAGPDHLVLVASSPEAPRTLHDAADEFAAVLANLIG